MFYLLQSTLGGADSDSHAAQFMNTLSNISTGSISD